MNKMQAEREIWDKATALIERSRKLFPPGGTVAVGGAYFDDWLRGEALFTLIRGIRNGKSLAEAFEAAKLWAREAVKTWNAKHEWQVQRWEGTADGTIETAWRIILNAQI